MQNPVTKVYRAYNHMFVNSTALVVEYHDVLRMNWFNILYFMANNQVADEYFDTSMFAGMETAELMEWYVMRSHRNILLDIPAKFPLPEDPEEKEKILDQFLFDMGQIPQLYALPAELNFHTIFSNLLTDGLHLISHYYIYGGKIQDPLMEKQIKETYGTKVPIDFLYGDFKEALEGINTDATYVLSDVEKVADLAETGRLECASVLVADGFRYNFMEDDDRELKINIPSLLEDYTCRISFFNNLEELHVEDENGNSIDPATGKVIPPEYFTVRQK